MKASRILIFSLATMSFAQTRDADFAKLADGYFTDVLFQYDPAQGTASGFHQYDALMPTFSRAEIQAAVAVLRKYETAAQNFDPRGLSPTAAADRELVLAQIRGQLLALEQIRGWEKNPDNYSSYATNAVFVIMSRTFAPPAETLFGSLDRALKGTRRNLLDEINRELADFERIRKFKILDREFSIEQGELTPTMKLRRNRVLENHRELVNEMYVGRDAG